MLMAMVVHGQTVVPEQIERFILETDPGLMRGYTHSEAPAEAPHVTRQLKALPPESLDIALKLFAGGPPNYENWRLRVCFFLWGMYRTHNVTPSQHRKTVAVIYKELIQPDSRPVDSGELSEGLEFIYQWGTADDMRLLVPLLNSRDSEVRKEVAKYIGAMARERNLPDPTAAKTNTPQTKPATPIPPAAQAPISSEANRTVESESAPEKAPVTSLSPVVAERKTGQLIYVVVGLVLVAAALVALRKKRRG